MEAAILKRRKRKKPLSANQNCSFNFKWLPPYGGCHFLDNHQFVESNFCVIPLRWLVGWHETSDSDTSFLPQVEVTNFHVIGKVPTTMIGGCVGYILVRVKQYTVVATCI